MEQTRAIYETLVGKRVSDTHWSKTKKLMADCQLPMDKQGFQVLAGLRQKTLLKYPQTYIPKGFYLVLIGLLLYLGYRRFWVFNVFPLRRNDLRLISSSKVFKSR